MIETDNKSLNFSGSGDIVTIPPNWAVIGCEIFVTQIPKIRHWNLTAKLNLALSLWRK